MKREKAPLLFPAYEPEAGYSYVPSFEAVEAPLTCKHGPAWVCLTCGVSLRNAAAHRTRGGLGEVGRALRGSERMLTKRQKPTKFKRRRKLSRARDRRVTIR
jgi:hypothetical protein